MSAQNKRTLKEWLDYPMYKNFKLSICKQNYEGVANINVKQLFSEDIKSYLEIKEIAMEYCENTACTTYDEWVQNLEKLHWESRPKYEKVMLKILEKMIEKY